MFLPFWYVCGVIVGILVSLMVITAVFLVVRHENRRNAAANFYHYVQRQEARARAKDHIDRLYQAAKDLIQRGTP